MDQAAGELHAAGATGGPEALSHQPFSIGVNDPLGGTPPGVDFNPVAFTLFDKWASQGKDEDSDGRTPPAPPSSADSRCLTLSRFRSRVSPD